VVTRNALTFDDTSLVPDTTYAYTVEAFDASGKISSSDEVDVTTPADSSSPSTPAHLTAELVDPATADIGWDEAPMTLVSWDTTSFVTASCSTPSPGQRSSMRASPRALRTPTRFGRATPRGIDRIPPRRR
jgi:chitodextrinase